MIYLGLLVISLFAIRNIKVDSYPEIQSRKILIETEFCNADAVMVREMVTIPLENTCLLLQNHKSISSISKDGISIVQIEFHHGTNMELALLNTKEVVDSVYNGLPYGCKKSTVKIIEEPDNFLIFALNKTYSGNLEVNQFMEKMVIPNLLRIKGVYDVVYYGGDVKEIQIQLDSEKLNQRKLTLQDIAEVCNLSNCDFSVGTISEGSNIHQVKVNGKIDDYRDWGKIIVKHDLEGGTIRINDLGIVKTEFKKRKNFASYDGKDCVLVTIKLNNDENPLKTSKKIKEQLNCFQKMNGGLYTFEIVANTTENMLLEIYKLLLQGLFGITVTFLFLLFFFKSIFLAATITLTIPLCLVFSIAILTITGNSLNIISLSGLTIGIGLIVDCSAMVAVKIVSVSDIENSAKSIRLSNLGSTATTVIAFLPVFFIEGLIKEFFSCLSMAIISCVAFSYIASTSITVSFIRLIKKNVNENDMHIVNLSKIEKLLRRTLLFFSSRPFVSFFTIALFIILGGVSFFNLGFEINSVKQTNCVTISIPFPANVTAVYIQEKSKQLYEKMKHIPRIKGILMTGGSLKKSLELSTESLYENTLEIELYFKNMEISKIQKILQNEFNFENCKISYCKNNLNRINDFPLGIFYLDGETIEELENKIKYLKNDYKLRFVPYEKKCQWVFIPSIEQLSKCGISSEYISGYLTEYMEGIKLNPVNENDFKLDAKIVCEKNESNIMDMLDQAKVYIDKKPVSISSLGKFSNENKDIAYYREGRKDAKLIFNVENEIHEKLKGKIKDRRNDNYRNMTIEFVMLIVLVIILIYFSIGILFESFKIPVLVIVFMFSAFPGSFILLFVFKFNFDFNVLVSLIILLGLSSNNTILIFEKIRKEKEINKNTIIECCCELTKMLFITNGTTILSLIPFVGSSSIAVSVIGGLLSSLGMNLILLPLIMPKWKLTNA